MSLYGPFKSPPPSAEKYALNWGRIGSGNDLSPVRRQVITWAYADFLSIGPLGKKSVEIFLFIKIHLRMSSLN